MGFESLNGSNLRVFHLTNELIKRGHDIRFITPDRNSARSCEERFGVEAEGVGLRITRFSRGRFKKYPVFALKASRKIERDAGLVFGQSLASALAVKFARTRAMKVVDYVDLWSEYFIYSHPGAKGRVMYRVLRKAESLSMRGVDLVFTITEKIREFLEERGCNPERIRVVRDGVDTGMFRPLRVGGEFLKKYGLEGKDYLVYQGGIAAHDGVQFLVDAAPLVLEENPDAGFLIVGKGDYLPELRKQVKRLGLEGSFKFTGWVPYQDMPSFMNLARINIVPIPNAPATQGVLTLKLFEAMACGTPTIISNLPAVREHMKHENTAYLVRSENKKELARGINELLNNKRLYNRIKRNGLKMVPYYDWRKIAGDMADLMI